MGPYEKITSNIREEKVDLHEKKIGRTWKNFAVYECTRIGEGYKIGRRVIQMRKKNIHTILGPDNLDNSIWFYKAATGSQGATKVK